MSLKIANGRRQPALVRVAHTSQLTLTVGSILLSSGGDAHQFFNLLGDVVPAEAFFEFFAAVLAELDAEIGIIKDALNAPNQALFDGVDQYAIMFVLQ